VEGDSKICFDVLNEVDDSGSWKIDTFVFYLKLHSCYFCWVRREANNVTYTLAKFVAHHSLTSRSMKLLGWNCRGICNTSTVRALKALVKGHCPQVIFLCETKASESRLQSIAISLGFTEHLIVAAQGSSGGVCLLWNLNLSVEVLEFNACTLAIKIHDLVSSWYLVGFYGPAYYKKRCKAWTNLCALLESFYGPWLCFSDFNSIFEANEKEGGRNGTSSAHNYLNNLMFDLGAVDLGLSGTKFTWCNKRWGSGCIRERLDRGIANTSWRLAFPRAVVFHLGVVKSNHCPILIDTNPVDVRVPRPFRFEAMWANDPWCFDVVNEAWQREVFGNDCFKLYKKQYFTTSTLQIWNKEVFEHCQSRINKITGKIEKIQCEALLEENFAVEAKLQYELNLWLSRNEIMWS
jgi:hypothetical protein